MTNNRAHSTAISGATLATTVLLATAARADLVISTDPTQNMSCSAGVCKPTAADAVLNITDLTNMLASGDVSVETFVGHRYVAKTIDIVVPLSWSSSNTLTLHARDPISVQQPITVIGSGSLILNSALNLAFGTQITFWDLQSKFAIYGAPYMLVGDVPTLAADIAANPTSNFALANDYDALNDHFAKAPIKRFAHGFEGLWHTISNLTLTQGYHQCEGLFSINNGIISHIRLSNVSLSSSSNQNIGPLAGCNKNVIRGASADGTASGNSTAVVGGLVGSNEGSISIAGAGVAVTGGQSGGVAGVNTGSILESYATGSVQGVGGTGGLVGNNKGSLSNVYALGSVAGGGGNAGGLVGFTDWSGQATSAKSAYAIGAVSGGGLMGGFVGYDPEISISAGYWDLDTSGISDPNEGAGFPANDPDVVGLNDAQLKSKRPYGFDKKMWGLDANINNGYPYLLANPPPTGTPAKRIAKTRPRAK